MPLHHAAATNHAAIAKTLLFFGADPDAQNGQASQDTSFTCCTSIADLNAYTHLIEHASKIGFALSGQLSLVTKDMFCCSEVHIHASKL